MDCKDKERGSSEASMNGSMPKEKEKEKEKNLPGQPSGSGGGPTFGVNGVTQSSGSSSFFNVSSNTATPHADHASARLHLDDLPHREHSSHRALHQTLSPKDKKTSELSGTQ
jgi:hypothetical protein